MKRHLSRPVAATLGIAAGFAFLFGLFFAIAPAGAEEAKASESASADKAALGQAAPDFKLMDQDGNPVSLSDFQDKVVVIEQFNDQCPYVVKWYKEGHMNDLAKKYAEQGVVWLAVDSSNFSNVEQNKEIAGKWNIDRPLLDDSSGEVGKQYDSRTTPHMRIVNKGTLAYDGAIDNKPTANTADIDGGGDYVNYVAQALDEILAGETVSVAETKPYGCSVKY